MTHKKFSFTIRGDVEPEKLRAGDLAHVLLALEQALLASAKAYHPDLTPDLLRFSLIRVKKGSGVLELVAPEEVASAAVEDSRLLAEGRVDELKPEARPGYRALSNQLDQRGWRGGFSGNGDLGIVESDVLGKIEIPLVEHRTRLSGSTSLYGRVIRVGGASRPKAELTPVLGGRPVPVHVSIDQAKTLARRLYTVVGIFGKAFWDSTWSFIEKFEASQILPYREQNSAQEAFAALAEAGGRVWEGVDPDEFVKSLRGEE